MNNKIKAISIIAILITFVGIQIIAAQQANDYKAYVYNQRIPEGQITDGRNITNDFAVAYVPVFPSTTYTFTSNRLSTLIDMSQPTKINDQIAAAVKIDGENKGYNVIRVFIPSYDMKIP